MRGKRVLTLMLAICMVLSVMAPAAAAATADSEGYKAALQSAAHSADASGDKGNSLIVSTEDAAKHPTLRDENAPEANKQNGKNPEKDYGGWVANSVEGDFSAGLLNPEVPASVAELRELAQTYAADKVVSAFVVMEDKPMIHYYSDINSVPADEEQILAQQQEAVVMMIEEDVLDGEDLKVTSQFTYITNSIVIDTEFGNLEKIAQIPGVSPFLLCLFTMPAIRTVR